MREDFFEFSPTWKLVLAANHQPAVRDATDSIWDRIRQVPFEVRIPPEAQDRALTEKLSTELPGILRWAVDGCLAWQRDGLGEPAAVKEATAGYRSDQDFLGRFLSDCCEAAKGAALGSTALHESYVGWCEAEGETPLKQRTFGMRLKARGWRHGGRSSAGRVQWQGWKLTPLGEQLRTNRSNEALFQVDRSSLSHEKENLKTGSDTSEGSEQPSFWGDA